MTVAKQFSWEAVSEKEVSVQEVYWGVLSGSPLGEENEARLNTGRWWGQR